MGTIENYVALIREQFYANTLDAVIAADIYAGSVMVGLTMDGTDGEGWFFAVASIVMENHREVVTDVREYHDSQSAYNDYRSRVYIPR
jgi:hypothetical protein